MFNEILFINLTSGFSAGEAKKSVWMVTVMDDWLEKWLDTAVTRY